MSSSIARSKCSIGIVPVFCSLDVHDARSPGLLRVPDLADRRELPVREDDLRPLRETETARQRAHSRGERRRHRDLVGACVDEPGEGAAGGFLPLDPVLPRRALVVPVLEVLLVGSAHRVRQRTLRARVDVHLPVEDREPVPAPSRERGGLNGQGRPSSSPRAQAALLRALPAPVARWRARSRGLRSRAPCSHSARRRASRRRTDAPAG